LLKARFFFPQSYFEAQAAFPMACLSARIPDVCTGWLIPQLFFAEVSNPVVRGHRPFLIDEVETCSLDCTIFRAVCPRPASGLVRVQPLKVESKLRGCSQLLLHQSKSAVPL
jgi:hypothetical protein